MALFRRPRTVVPASVTGSLAEYGKAVIAAKRSSSTVTDPRFGWEFVSQVLLTMNEAARRDQVIRELYDAAQAAADRPMATVGAYKLLCEWDGNLRDERFLALRDAYLNLMRQMRFSSAHLNGYEVGRWAELRGDPWDSFDRITDAGAPPQG